MKRNRYIHVRLRGDFYPLDPYCTTLKQFMEEYNVKRSAIAEWWKD